MKTLINNNNNLLDTDITNITKKVRAIILDKKNNFYICNYADMYMFPGGKIDSNETPIEALKRELQEELGITFKENQIEGLLTTKNYYKNYPIRNTTTTENKLTTTTYFLIEVDTLLPITNQTLTTFEQNNNFYIEIANLNNIANLLNKPSSNIRNIHFQKELLTVIKELEYVELHAHSTHSDGEFTPNELLEQAIKQNIKTFALTDHDRITGVKELKDSDLLKQINFIPGIELSGQIDKGIIHILGYNIDITNQQLNDKLNSLKQKNHNYIRELLNIINQDYNITFSEEEINNLFTQTNNLSRADLAKLCVKNKYTKNTQEAFDKYLIPAYKQVTNYKGIPPKECINLILNSGGIPVLAHPYTLEKEKSDLHTYIRYLKEIGLQGLEVYRPNHTNEQSEFLLKIAKEEKLLISAGSDYHGLELKPYSLLKPVFKRKNLTLLDKIQTKKDSK